MGTATITVEPVVFLFFVALNLEIVTLQDLINTKCCFQLINTDNITLCQSVSNETRSTIKADASLWLMYHNGLLCLLSLIFGLWIGSWNDKFGRKRPMLIPPVGGIFGTTTFVFISYFRQSDVAFVLIGSVILGISTGTLGIVSSCFGYVADMTGLEARSRRIAVLEAAIYTGGACGMYLAGIMLKTTSYEAIFALEAGLHALTVVYILAFVKDGHRPDEFLARSEGRKSLFGVSHVADVVRTVFRSRENGHRHHVILLLLSTLVMSYGLAAQIYLTYTFLTDEPLGWSASQYGFLHGVTIAVSGTALLALLPLAFRFLALSDAGAGLVGAVSRCVGLAWLGLCTNSTMVYFTPVFFAFSEFGIPATRSILSKVMAPDEKGKAFALMGSLQSVAMFVGAVTFNGLYPVTSKFFKGFGFELAATFQLIPVAVFMYLCWKLRYTPPSPYREIESTETDRSLEAV